MENVGRYTIHGCYGPNKIPVDIQWMVNILMVNKMMDMILGKT